MKYWNSTIDAEARPETTEDWHKVPRLYLAVGLLVSVTLLAAVAGPFGTYEAAGFLSRLVYWSVVNTVSVVIALSLRVAVAAVLPRQSQFVSEMTVIVLMTFVFTPFLWVWTNYWFAYDADQPPGMVRLGLYVFVISAIISSLRHGVPRVVGARHPTEDEAVQPVLIEPVFARLTRRLPDGPAHNILRLTVDGHKVLVITSCSVFEVRMRFADAVEEMDGVEGFCTHRSHWVARAAVVGANRASGKIELQLINGDTVPVSRKYRPDLEAAGII